MGAFSASRELMEYLQLLVILQHVAVGGTALVGFSYLFLGSESVGEFLRRELGEWKLRTTLLWVTGSFTVGYAVEDLARMLIDQNRGVVYIGGLTVDKLVGEWLLEPFFTPDTIERYNVLWSKHGDGKYYLTDLGIEVFEVLEDNRGKELKDAGASREGVEGKPAGRGMRVEDSVIRKIEGFFPEGPTKGDSAAWRDYFFELLEKYAPGLDDVGRPWISSGDYIGVRQMQNAVLFIYYVAHNVAVRKEVYATELGRFDERLRFLRALGFLGGLFFVLYAVPACLSYKRDVRWTICLALCGAVFIYWLLARDPATLLQFHTVPFVCALLFVVLFLALRARAFWDPQSAKAKWFRARIVDWTEAEERWVNLYLGELDRAFVRLRSLVFDSDPANQKRALFAADPRIKRVERSNGLAKSAVVSFVALVLCSIGAHAESVEYSLRIFGYFVSMSQHAGTVSD